MTRFGDLSRYVREKVFEPWVRGEKNRIKRTFWDIVGYRWKERTLPLPPATVYDVPEQLGQMKKRAEEAGKDWDQVKPENVPMGVTLGEDILLNYIPPLVYSVAEVSRVLEF